MEYSVHFGVWNSVFAVPTAVVDQHIRLAGALQLKVLLWILRHSGTPFTAEHIAEAVGANSADVRDAMQYWVITGILCEEPAKFENPEHQANNSTLTNSAQMQQSASQKANLPPRRLPKPDNAFIAKRSAESEEISVILQEAQTILGRALSPGLSSGLVMLHDDYGLPVDVILMLLQYAKSRNHDNTSYIESVGKSWAAEGITSHERAEQKLRLLDEISSAWRRLQSILCIDRRSPSLKEEQFALTWISEWHFTDAMIREAYNRCIDATGKMKLSYMNKVLENWHQKGISTPEAAALEQISGKNKTSKKTSSPRNTTYDLDALKEMDMMSLPPK